MGKGKRNKASQRVSERFYDLANARESVKAAELKLLQARRRAAIAAHEVRAGQPTQAAPQRHPLAGARRSNKAMNLDAGTTSPQDQAEAFFNRPGDYFLAKFTVGGHVDKTSGVNFMAETVLKADEDQLDYLLEVLRQIRGGFGDKCRIELTRTHTVDKPASSDVEAEALASLPEVGRAGEQATSALRRAAGIPDGPPVDMRDVTLGPRQRGPEIVGDDGNTDAERNGQVPPWLSGATRAELAAQLPGMTRAEAAAQTGRDPATLGDTVQHVPPSMTVDELAAELGVPVEALIPISMRGGGTAYAIKPPPAAPEGRHAAGIVGEDTVCDSVNPSTEGLDGCH